MVIPVKARKGAGIGEGDVLAVEVQGDGRLLLVRLDRPKPFQPTKARIILRKGKHSLGDTGQPITSAQVKQLLKEPCYRPLPG
jgi:bifunctional DNA-binding transcriptional regulator/antitoxin component of YhaV-PrlF toxin-antitoxin module